MVYVRDTGLLDLSNDLISKETINFLTLADEGIDAVLFVLSVRNRISQEEEYALNSLQRIFGSKIFEYLIFLLTNGEKFEANEFEDYFRECCPEFLMVWSAFSQNAKNFFVHTYLFFFSLFCFWVLVLEFQKVLRFCNGRKVLFNNMTNDEGVKAEQVNQIMAHVAAISKKNDGPYTNDMYRHIKVSFFIF